MLSVILKNQYFKIVNLLLALSFIRANAQVIISPQGQSIGNNQVQKQLLVQKTEDSAYAEIKSVVGGFNSEADAILKLTTLQNAENSSIFLRKYGPLSYDIIENTNLYNYGAFFSDRKTAGLKIGALKNGGDLEFYTSAHSRLFIDSTGKFGFNTNLPQSKYHFYQNTTGEIIRIQGIWPTISIYDQNVAKGYLNANPNDFQIGSIGNMPFKLRTGNSDRVTIMPNGNIGIDTDSPLYGLDIRTNLNIGSELLLDHHLGSAGAVATSAGPGLPPYWRNPTAIYAICTEQLIPRSTTIPNTYYGINYSTEKIDENNELSGSTFTASQNGIYKIEITIFEESHGVHITDLIINAYKNFDTIPIFSAFKKNMIIGRLNTDTETFPTLFGTITQHNFELNEMLKLNAGDKLTFKITSYEDYTLNSKIMIYAIR